MSEADGAAELTVGRILPLSYRASHATLRRLNELVRDGVPERAVADLRDPRLGQWQWGRAFARELATTLGWLTRRLLLAATPVACAPVACAPVASAPPAPVAAGAGWPGHGRVLSLLPRHGHAVHLLRRALPFVLCGVHTAVAMHEDQVAELRGTLRGLVELLCLAPDAVELVTRPARDEVLRYGANDLVVLTGRTATAAAVAAATSAKVIAATGSCVVLVGTEPTVLARTAAELSRHDLPDSCTRLHSSWQGESRDDSVWRRDGLVEKPAEVLAAAHPTAIYWSTGDLNQAPRICGGYVASPCAADGSVGSLVGFARDPRHGWPGDFLV